MSSEVILVTQDNNSSGVDRALNCLTGVVEHG